MTPTNPQQEAQTSEARPASKSALEAARVVLYPFRGLVSEQQIQDAAGVIDEAFDDVLSALKDVPDPHNEGFCDSCSTTRQLPLKKEGGRYFFQHDDSCWYGKIQAIVAKAEKQP